MRMAEPVRPTTHGQTPAQPVRVSQQYKLPSAILPISVTWK